MALRCNRARPLLLRTHSLLLTHALRRAKPMSKPRPQWILSKRAGRIEWLGDKNTNRCRSQGGHTPVYPVNIMGTNCSPYPSWFESLMPK